MSLPKKLALSAAPAELEAATDKLVFLNVRVPSELRQRARLHALRRGKSLQDVIVNLLTRELEN